VDTVRVRITDLCVSGVLVSTSKQERRLIRTRQRTPDFVRKAGPHTSPKRRSNRAEELQEAVNEWAEDYQGTHDIFE
jgi:hypothetical protein